MLPYGANNKTNDSLFIKQFSILQFIEVNCVIILNVYQSIKHVLIYNNSCILQLM